jgi:leucyl-tRNA synthetase
MREKYSVKDFMVLPFDPIPIIYLEGYGDLSAPTVYERLNIQSQYDSEKLAQAKDEIYKKSFYEGILLKGKYQQHKIIDVKKSIQNDLIADKQACIYHEPENKVNHLLLLRNNFRFFFNRLYHVQVMTVLLLYVINGI